MATTQEKPKETTPSNETEQTPTDQEPTDQPEVSNIRALPAAAALIALAPAFREKEIRVMMPTSILVDGKRYTALTIDSGVRVLIEDAVNPYGSPGAVEAELSTVARKLKIHTEQLEANRHTYELADEATRVGLDETAKALAGMIETESARVKEVQLLLDRSRQFQPETQRFDLTFAELRDAILVVGD